MLLSAARGAVRRTARRGSRRRSSVWTGSRSLPLGFEQQTVADLIEREQRLVRQDHGLSMIGLVASHRARSYDHPARRIIDAEQFRRAGRFDDRIPVIAD